METGQPILVVDDDEMIRDFVGMVLTEEGFEVLTAPDGAAALDLADEHQPSLILLDMRMPGVDGWGFAHEYRQRPGPHAPIVVVTAAVDAAESAAEIAAEGYLAKPFDLDDLLQVVSRYAKAA